MPNQRNAIRKLERTEYQDETFASHMNSLGTMITPPDDGGVHKPLSRDDIDKAVLSGHIEDKEEIDYWYDTVGDDLNLSNFLGKDFLIELTHGMVVSNVAVLVARELNLDNDTCDKVALGGMVHDIGKLKINSYVDYEQKHSMRIDQMRYVRTHPTLGYAALTEMGFDKDVCEAVFYHHENYDGTGYPSNLSGEDIPLMARILRVSDVFSALISDRSYREAFDIDSAVELMIDEVRHFDMRVFLAFQRVIQSNELILALGNLSRFTNKEFRVEFNHVQHAFQSLEDD
jgi:putative nucleotidyltransferase with HDIG domain